MKIVVQESETLKDIFREVCHKVEPDYEITGGVLPDNIKTELRRLIMLSLTYADDEHESPDYGFVVDLREDPVIVALLNIPWTKFDVLDDQGTLILYIGD